MQQSAPAHHKGTLVVATPDNPLVLTSGRRLDRVEVAYETWGELAADGGNAVVICHALTGDAHVAADPVGDGPVGDGPDDSGHGRPLRTRRGWWESMVGPGKPVDTSRYFVICTNLLGGCQGTTGPSSIDPATGAPYAMDFPLLTVADFVAVQRRTVAALGVQRLHAAVGGSLGGMQVLQWLLDAPEQIERAVIIAASSRLSAQNIAFSAVARQAIMRDEHFAGGRYHGSGVSPDVGLAIARMMAHITYLSDEAMDVKFGRRIQDADAPRFGFDTDFQVESYLDYQGRAFLNRFDALSYLYLSRALDYFDPFGEPATALGARLEAVRAAGARVFVGSFTSDWRFSTAHSLRIVRQLSRAGIDTSFREFDSRWGHDSFLLPHEEYLASVAAFVRAERVPSRAIAGSRGSGAHAVASATASTVVQPAQPAGTPPRADAGPGGAGAALRPDLRIVADLVAPGSRVLDLGCGDGELLAHLIATHGCRGVGVERSGRDVIGAIARGVPVLSYDLDALAPDMAPLAADTPDLPPPGVLARFDDDAFDLVVVSQTLQATRSPAEVLRQIRRIAPVSIVSVPNFALWRHRMELLVRGRMPVSRQLPYAWHDTPNIHLSTLRDLESLVVEAGLRVRDRVVLDEAGAPVRPARAANILGARAVYRLERAG